MLFQVKDEAVFSIRVEIHGAVRLTRPLLFVLGAQPGGDVHGLIFHYVPELGVVGSQVVDAVGLHCFHVSAHELSHVFQVVGSDVAIQRFGLLFAVPLPAALPSFSSCLHDSVMGQCEHLAPPCDDASVYQLVMLRAFMIFEVAVVAADLHVLVRFGKKEVGLLLVALPRRDDGTFVEHPVHCHCVDVVGTRYISEVDIPRRDNCGGPGRGYNPGALAQAHRGHVVLDVRLLQLELGCSDPGGQHAANSHSEAVRRSVLLPHMFQHQHCRSATHEADKAGVLPLVAEQCVSL